MAVPKVDTFKDYTRYAEHCLNMVASTTDQELRCIQREMAAEWLRLLARPMNGNPGPPQRFGVASADCREVTCVLSLPSSQF